MAFAKSGAAVAAPPRAQRGIALTRRLAQRTPTRPCRPPRAARPCTWASIQGPLLSTRTAARRRPQHRGTPRRTTPAPRALPPPAAPLTAALACALACLQNPLLGYTYGEHTHNATVAKFSPSGFYIASGDESGRCAWRPCAATAIGGPRAQPRAAPRGRVQSAHLGHGQRGARPRQRVPAAQRPHPRPHLVRGLQGEPPRPARGNQRGRLKRPRRARAQRIVVVGEGRESFGAVFLADSGSSVGAIEGHSAARRATSADLPVPHREREHDQTTVFFEGPPSGSAARTPTTRAS